MARRLGCSLSRSHNAKPQDVVLATPFTQGHTSEHSTEIARSFDAAGDRVCVVSMRSGRDPPAITR